MDRVSVKMLTDSGQQLGSRDAMNEPISDLYNMANYQSTSLVKYT